MLILGAAVILVAAVLIVLWQYADRRVRPQLTTGEAKELESRLDSAAVERQDLKRRIEQLEAIASERPLKGGL